MAASNSARMVVSFAIVVISSVDVMWALESEPRCCWFGVDELVSIFRHVLVSFLGASVWSPKWRWLSSAVVLNSCSDKWGTPSGVVWLLGLEGMSLVLFRFLVAGFWSLA